MGGLSEPLDWAKNGFLGAIGEGLGSQLELLFFLPEGQSEAAEQRVKFWGTFFRSQDDKCHKIARWQGPLFLSLYDKCRIFGDKVLQ